MPTSPGSWVRPLHPQEKTLQLSPNLLVLGTRNTADRTIARMDIAIRRRFAFIEMWPDLAAVEAEGEELATGAFTDAVTTFSEFTDDEILRLVPGHACFLDPRPDKVREGRTRRVAHRMKFELLPLLRHYLEETVPFRSPQVVRSSAAPAPTLMPNPEIAQPESVHTRKPPTGPQEPGQ